MTRPPLRERLKVAWMAFRGQDITLGRHWSLRLEMSNTLFAEMHSCVFHKADGEWGLIDNCDPPCDAQEARALGGEIWERYAIEVEQRAGPDGVEPHVDGERGSEPR